MDKTVKIRVSEEAREALRKLGRKGESYDAVIRRLLVELDRRLPGGPGP